MLFDLADDFMAWEFNYKKIADPVSFMHINISLLLNLVFKVFADCDILLTDSDERCGFDETQLDIDDRASYMDTLIDYWNKKSTKMQFSNFTKQYSLSIYWSSLTLTTSGQQVCLLYSLLIKL